MFNFHPTQSLADYRIPSETGSYKIVLDTDSHKFGGQSRVDTQMTYHSHSEDGGHYLMLYLPARTAIVLKKEI